MAGKTQVIAVGNQKGGVAKTTISVTLAAALGQLGKRVLVVDLDPQGGATRCYGVPGEAYEGSFEVLTGHSDMLEVIVRTNAEEGISLPKNVDLITADEPLGGAEAELQQKAGFTDYRDCLTRPLQPVIDRGLYDFVFLDTAPNIHAPTVGAYRAARWFLLTAKPEPLAIDGLGIALKHIGAVRESSNPDLELLGVVLSCVNEQTRLGRELLGYVKRTFAAEGVHGEFETRISRTVAVPEAQHLGRTIIEANPTHKVTLQYMDLAREVIARTSGKSSPRRAKKKVAKKAGKKAGKKVARKKAVRTQSDG